MGRGGRFSNRLRVDLDQRRRIRVDYERRHRQLHIITSNIVLARGSKYEFVRAIESGNIEE
jgi:hypothetical protein